MNGKPEDPDRSSAIAEVARLVESQDFAAADAACWDLIVESPEKAGLWQLRGNVAAAASNWSKAQIYFQRALTMSPNGALAWLGLARSAAALENHQLAGQAAESALELGLDGDEAAIASFFAAQSKMIAGHRETGLLDLSALAEFFRKRCTTATEDVLQIVGYGIAAAICANDSALVEHLLHMLYPHASKLGPVAISPTATLAQWCSQHDGSYNVIAESEHVQLEATSAHGQPFSYRTDSLAYAHIPGGGFIPGWDFAIAPDGTVLTDTNYFGVNATFNFLPHSYFEAAQLIGHHAPKRMNLLMRMCF